MEDLTLGHVLVAVAGIDLIAMLLMVRAQREKPGVTDEQRRALNIIVAAAFAVAVGLCLFAFFHPIARMRVL